MVLLECRVIGAEHFRVRLGKFVPLELDVGELQGADAVSDLGEPVLPGVGHPIQNGLFGEDEVQRAVKGAVTICWPLS